MHCVVLKAWNLCNCDLQLVDYLQVCTTVYILAVLLHVQH